MKMRARHGLLGLTLLAAATPRAAQATNSPVELRTALFTLAKWIEGRFDSEPQRYFEEESQFPKEAIHGRVFRSFVRIDAPEVGSVVFVATVRYGGQDGLFDNGEFQVWTLEVDAAKAAIRMWPRRFKDPARYKDRALDATAFRGLAAADLVPAEGAAACDLWWRLNGKQLLGRTTSGGCPSMSTTMKRVLRWEWEFLLNDEELWIVFAGRDETGKIVNGREDQTHWRLSRVTDYECFVSFREDGGGEASPSAQLNNGFRMHDRGDTYRWQYKEAGVTKDMFLTLNRGMWPSNSGRNYLEILRLEAYEGKPEEPIEKRLLIGAAHASGGSDRAAFTTPRFSARCKVFDPNAPPPAPNR
jgi:hypothetical protein